MDLVRKLQIMTSSYSEQADIFPGLGQFTRPCRRLPVRRLPIGPSRTTLCCHSWSFSACPWNHHCNYREIDEHVHW